jgi:sulfite exporter TauE/SafE
MIAAIIFLVTAFPSLSAAFPWAARIRLPGIFSVIAHKGYDLFHAQGTWSRYLLGLTLGFLPCGLVIAALMAASTASNVLEAATAMSAFTIGTMPSLIAIGLCGHRFKQKFPALSHRFSCIAMLASSLWLFALAGSLIF